MCARHLFVWVLVLGLVGLSGCSSRERALAPETSGELLATAVIGPGGGILTGGEVTLIVPPGAFSQEVELKLHLADDESPFAGRDGSALYRMDGLPSSFFEPLGIRFPISPGESGGMVAMGEENFVPSAGGLLIGYQMLPTTVMDTLATGTIPAMEDRVNGAEDGLSVWLICVTDYESEVGNGGPGARDGLTTTEHFSIAYPKGKKAEAERLQSYLEEAYSTFESWPFSFSRRTSWPISVTICDLPSGTFGYSVPSRMGDNYGSLEFNTKVLDDHAELKVSAAHELFHLGQALYDNRNRWSKARNPSDRYWLDEAASVWCEKFFSSQTDYSSKVRTSREMKPFDRFHVSASGDHPGFHGYGMSPLFEYLVRNRDLGVVGRIYQRIFENGNDPVAAVLSVQSDPFKVWHPEFLQELIQSDLTPDVSLANAIAFKEGTWEVRTSADKTKSFTQNYFDGGARFYQIKLTNPNFTPATVLDLEIDNATDGRISVYRYRGSSLEGLGLSTDTYHLENLDNLVQEGWNLLVMVSSTHLTSPYGSALPLTLSLEVKIPSGFRSGWANVAGEANYDIEISTPDSSWAETNAYYTGWGAGLPGYVFVDGYSSGNTFTSDYVDENSGTEYEGRMSITVDDADDPSWVVSFTYTVQQSDENGWTSVRKFTCSGSGVPLTSAGNGEYQFTIDDPSASSYVDRIEETTTFTNRDYESVSTLRDVTANFVTIRLKR